MIPPLFRSRPASRRLGALVFLAYAALAARPLGAYTPDPSPDIEVEDTQEEGTATLVLETNVTGADIYLNRVFLGRTPHRQKGVQPGIHVLRFELDGYRPRELVLDLKEKRAYIVKIQLVPRTGWLSIEVQPPDADVFLDGAPVRGSLVEAPAGTRAVRAYRFGYREALQTVYVPEDGVAAVRFVLEAAPFSLSELRIRRPSFNPANPGALGSAEIRFTVTSFGRAELEVRDSSGRTVAEIPVPPFTQSQQTAVWDGRDGTGRPLPDGEYSLTLKAHPEGEASAPSTDSLERRGSVRIDSSLLLAPKSLSGGLSGLALYPDPFTDPARILRFAASYRPRFPREGRMEGSAFALGAQAALGGRFEVSLQAALDPESSQDGSAGIGIKGVFFRSEGFASAAFLGAAFSSGSISGEPASPSPLRAGLSAALGTARLHGGAALEIELPSWEADSPRLGARAGFSWTNGRLSAGISASVHTEPLGQGFALDDSVSLALEGRSFLFSLPIALELCLGADFGPGGLESFRPAVGLSVVF